MSRSISNWKKEKELKNTLYLSTNGLRLKMMDCVIQLLYTEQNVATELVTGEDL